ncbi:MAG: pantoate--beta-alanine ligase [Planctomycetota bacterium]|nr:pantoate--beta-alanine ligase [Planctomycetota bacterium]
MKVAKTIEEIRILVFETRSSGANQIGLVPTMGALHEGHFSLIEIARSECDFVAVSIFVNPTQFGPNEDYRRYPRPLEEDLAGCESRGIDAVFAPSVDEMYPAGFVTTVSVAGLTESMEGLHRPGHFDGVCTVVAKLFNIVTPDVAYFGAKDYQQATVIKKMVADLDMPLRINLCPTIREADGLAMSSRNAYLSDDERSQSSALSESLSLAERLIREGSRKAEDIITDVHRHLTDKAPLGKVDYVAIVKPDSLEAVETVESDVMIALAVRFPSARLIDNVRVGMLNNKC